jgi:hypothetical protein
MFFINKITFPRGIWLLLFLVMVISACSKTDFPELKDNKIGFDPATEKEEVNRILQVKGAFMAESALPAKSNPINLNGFNFQVPDPYIIHIWPKGEGNMDSIEIGNELMAYIPVKIKQVDFGQYFKTTNIFMKVTGASGHWKIPVSPESLPGEEYFTISVPSLVREGSFEISLCAELVCVFPGYESIRVFTDTVNALLNIRPPLQCGSIVRGSSGLSIRKLDFGNSGSGKVNVRFITGGIPDRFDIRINGKYVLSSCPSLLKEGTYPQCSENTCFVITGNEWRDFEFDYNSEEGTFADVLIMGYCEDRRTGWSLQVNCPK